MTITKYSLIFLSVLLLASTAFADQRPLIFIGQDQQSILDYIRDTGQQPDGFMGYTSVQYMEGIDAPKDSGAGIQHFDYLIKNFPRAQMQIGLYMVDALQGVSEGQYDDNIKKLIRWCKKSGVPVFLRIGYEFDGPHNHYDPAQYIKAYRHVVDLFRQYDARNVRFVWHSYAAYVEGDLLRWYPGDDYVDWIGISYFDAYGEANRERVARIARQKNKPLMIAEATPRGYRVGENENVWKMWFAKLFDFMDKHDVKVLCYINTDWETAEMFKGQGWGDSRIEQSAVIKSKWLEYSGNIRGQRQRKKAISDKKQ